MHIQFFPVVISPSFNQISHAPASAEYPNFEILRRRWGKTQGSKCALQFCVSVLKKDHFAKIKYNFSNSYGNALFVFLRFAFMMGF